MNRILKNLLLVTATLFLVTPAKAQMGRCATDEVLQQQLNDNPSMQLVRDEIERHTQEYISNQHTGDRSVITIPVVVHVIFRAFIGEDISDEQIQSQIDILNNDFRKLNADINQVPGAFAFLADDCEINFCLAKQDPNGCSTTGIERREKLGFAGYDWTDASMKFYSLGGLDTWDRDKYLNIWVCGLNGDVLGFATFPGGGPDGDGVVVQPGNFGATGSVFAPYNKGRTATHEIGHWLNLNHIWGDLGCNNSDLVDDTPNQDLDNSGCPSFPHVSCNNGPAGDMFMNYMDYVDDACMVMFSKGQKSRMAATLSASGPRASLRSSTGCLPPCGCDNKITEIFTNTLYASDMGMDGDIIIHSGAQLIIEATIAMPLGSRILVERNARLIIRNGGKVTRCGIHWQGIQVLGNHQKAQPQRFALLTDPDQSGIVWLDNATVEGARCGITAGGGYGPEFWGGLVWTNQATFQNNRKDVEFMPYKFKRNKSRFFSTVFSEIDGAVVGTEGVSIWETNDIEFHNCTFKNKDLEGIRTYDAAIKVLNNNQFEGNTIGISAYSTYPTSSKTTIGSASTIENKFFGNTFDILADNISGHDVYALDIVNNNFTDQRFGITVSGGTSFRIAGNLLKEGISSLRIINTGFNNPFNQNLIGCNTFRYGPGISASGNNKEVLILGNDFETSGYDLLLKETTSPQIDGSIRETQGGVGFPAANCFTDPPFSPDIITDNNTTTFKYYYQENQSPFSCISEPIIIGNYTKEFVATPPIVIDCYQFGGLPPDMLYPSPSDLNTRRTTLQQLAPYIATNDNALNQYYKTLQEKDAILRYLLNQALTSELNATAEGLLAGEQSKAADWAIFGLRMERGDFIGAANWLNQLAVQNDEDIKFRDVQSINLQRLQNQGTFQISVAQEAVLNSVAESNSPVRGFARGILGLLKDRRFYPDEITPGDGDGVILPPTSASRVIGKLRVFPVPASSILTVSWPSLPAESDAQLLVYDVYGRQQINEQIAPLETERVLETGQLPTGVYFLIIAERGKVIHKITFNIQR